MLMMVFESDETHQRFSFAAAKSDFLDHPRETSLLDQQMAQEGVKMI
jgi:hypothetical protein